MPSPKVHKKPTFPLNNMNAEALLKFAAQNLAFRNQSETFEVNSRLASMAFEKGNESLGYLKKISTNYKAYFDYDPEDRLKKRLNLHRIAKDFPTWFDNYNIQNTVINKEAKKEIPDDFVLRDELIKAIEDEIKAAAIERHRNTYEVISNAKPKSTLLENTYDLRLRIEKDDFIKILEGMPVILRLGMIERSATALDYDATLSILTITTETDVTTLLNHHKDSTKVILDPVWLLEIIKNRLEKFELDAENPLRILSNKKLAVEDVIKAQTEASFGNLDSSQKSAINHALNHAITLLWGPPGTGKSYSLGQLLLNFLISGERTLVCCTANVAVDSIARATIHAIETYTGPKTLAYKNGQVLRTGYTRDTDLLGQKYLFPSTEAIIELRHRIQEWNHQLTTLKEIKRKEVLKKIVDAKKQLKELIKIAIQKANIVFSTASSVHADPLYEDLRFDNLIIDEASMMSVPHFVVLTENIRKRIILAGDFRQLGPVALATTKNARDWLHKDLFEFAGLDYRHGNMAHPNLVQLTVQRRFHRAICSLINAPLYDNKLTTAELESHNLLRDEFPAAEKSVAYIELLEENGFKCERTKKGSRTNVFSVHFIFNEIIQPMAHHHKLAEIKTIGIISPYRGQINEHNRLLAGANLPDELKRKIKTGTIHAYQGSEADLLIFDLVDSSHESLGKLYQLEQGLRLINVAVSRARSKLLVVGNINSILDGHGKTNLHPLSRNILERISRNRSNINYH